MTPPSFIFRIDCSLLRKTYQTFANRVTCYFDRLYKGNAMANINTMVPKSKFVRLVSTSGTDVFVRLSSIVSVYSDSINKTYSVIRLVDGQVVAVADPVGRIVKRLSELDVTGLPDTI